MATKRRYFVGNADYEPRRIYVGDGRYQTMFRRKHEAMAHTEHPIIRRDWKSPGVYRDTLVSGFQDWRSRW